MPRFYPCSSNPNLNVGKCCVACCERARGAARSRTWYLGRTSHTLVLTWSYSRQILDLHHQLAQGSHHAKEKPLQRPVLLLQGPPEHARQRVCRESAFGSVVALRSVVASVGARRRCQCHAGERARRECVCSITSWQGRRVLLLRVVVWSLPQLHAPPRSGPPRQLLAHRLHACTHGQCPGITLAIILGHRNWLTVDGVSFTPR